MTLVINNNQANWTLTLTNGSGGVSAKNTISIATVLTETLDSAAVARIANLFRDNLAPLLDNSWLLGPTHVLFKQDDVLQTNDDTGTEAGTASSTPYAPPATAHVVKKITGLAGRKYRGRVYFPGVPESAVDEAGVLDGARVNAVTAAFAALRTALIADTAIGSLVLLHDSETAGPFVGATIGALVCGNVVGTMRPRQRR